MADIRFLVDRVHGLNPKTPIFLLGESMGGGIVLHAAAQNPEHLAGVIASVPGASRYQQAKEVITLLLHLPFGLNRPMNISKSLLPKATRSPQLRAAWSSHPLARKMLSPKELMSFQQFMSDNGKFAARIKTKPVLVIQGMQDHLVKPPSTVKLYSTIPSKDKSLLKINSGEHLSLELNQCSPVVFEQLASWITLKSR